MQRAVTKLLVLFLLAGSAGDAWSAGCRATETKRDGHPALLMENDLVAVRILPTQRGTIDDYRLKPKNKMTLYCFTEARTEVLRGTGIYTMDKIDASGNRDALWPAGIETFNGAYSWKIGNRAGDRVSVSLLGQGAGWKVEKILTLSEGDVALDVEVKVTNTGKASNEMSYWNQSFLRLADDLMAQPGQADEILLMPARVEGTPVQGVGRKQEREEIVPFNAEEQKDVFLPPHQPWLAAVDKNELLVFGIYYDIDKFPSDAMSYAWPGAGKSYSMEMVFPREMIGPGQTRTYRMRMMAFTNISAVSLLRPNYGVYLASAVPATGEVRCKVVAFSSRKDATMKLALGLGDGKTEAFAEPAVFDFTKAGDLVTKDIVIPAAKIGKGEYGVYLREDGGKTFKLTGQSVKIQ